MGRERIRLSRRKQPTLQRAACGNCEADGVRKGLAEENKSLRRVIEAAKKHGVFIRDPIFGNMDFVPNCRAGEPCDPVTVTQDAPNKLWNPELDLTTVLNRVRRLERYIESGSHILMDEIRADVKAGK